MEDVFSKAIREARAESFRLATILFLRELRDYPSSLWREQRRHRRRRKAAGNSRTFDLADDFDGPGRWPAPTRLETAATILPFVLSGLLVTLAALDYAGGSRVISFHWNLSLYLILLLGLGIGWVRRFPRWSLGYLGMALINSWWLGGRGWISLLAVVFVATLLSKSFTPLARLGKGIWRDWSRLSFISYGALTFLALGVWYDGKTFYSQIAYLPIKISIVALVYVMGALFYLRVQSTWRRALTLQAAFSLAMLSGVLIGWLQNGRVDMAAQDSVSWWLFVIFALNGLMLLPGMLGIIRRSTQRPNLA